MDENRNQRAVERKLKEAMKIDRARIRMGRISPFGLMELSRQRLRPSLAEASMERCVDCGGTGVRRSVESSAVHALRAIEEEGLQGRSAEIQLRVPAAVGLYILNPQAPDAGGDRAALRFRRQLRAGRQSRAAELRDRADRGPDSAH